MGRADTSAKLGVRRLRIRFRLAEEKTGVMLQMIRKHLKRPIPTKSITVFLEIMEQCWICSVDFFLDIAWLLI